MVVVGAELCVMAAGSAEEEHISMDDSDRENFRRRGRSPASKRAGGGRGGDRDGRGRGEEHIAMDEFGRIADRRDNEGSERRPGSYRGRRSREGERSEEESARGLERRDNGRRRERSPGSTGGGGGRRLGHEFRDRGDEDNKPAKGSDWEDNNGRRMRERSPGSRRERVTNRDREQGERQFERSLERRDNWRRDRSPGLSRRGGSREREHRRSNGGREKSPRRSERGYKRDRGDHEQQDDYARGGSGRGGDYRRRERSPALRGVDNREKHRGHDGDAQGSSDKGDDQRKERIHGSNDGSVETRDRNLEVDSPHGAKEDLSPSSEQDMVSTEEQEEGLRTVDIKRRDLIRKSQSHNSREGAVRETSVSGSARRKSGDDESSDGEDSPEEGEVGAVKKVKVLSKIATDVHRNAASDDDERVYSQEFRRVGKDPRNRVNLDLEYVDSGEESEEDEESDDARRSKKRKAKRKEKHSKRHGRKHDKRSRGRKSKRRTGSSSDSASESEDNASSSGKSEVSESEEETHREKKKARRHRKKRGEASDSSEDEAQREKDKKRRKKRRQKEKERELEKERKRKLKKKRELKEKKLRAELKKKKKEMRSKKPITSSWGKYGIIKDIDMWNKKPEFGAWLAEVKKVDTETLTNWEEKQMFKEYMEDYNTATFPSKKYFNLDIYHRRKEAKERMKGMAKALVQVERTDFNDEDERRLELQKDREQRKEAELKALMQKMQSGMAQDMKEQAQLREDMQYQYRLGNVEAAQAIQRRLDPDAENK